MKNAKPKQTIRKKRARTAPASRTHLPPLDVETAWGPVHVVKRIVERFLGNYYTSPASEKEFEEALSKHPMVADGFRYNTSIQRKVWDVYSCISQSESDDEVWMDNPTGGATCIRRSPRPPDYSSLPQRVLAADQWAQTVVKAAPEKGPGRKRNTTREMTTEEKKQAADLFYASCRAANNLDVRAFEKNGGIAPNFCLDQLSPALSPPPPLSFSVASVPVQLPPDQTSGKYREAWVDASQMLQQAGLDPSFIELFRKAAYRAELESFCSGVHSGSREDVKEVWAALWADISLFLHQRGLPVTSVIATHIALSLWEQHGSPFPMTSRNKQGNTKEPTVAGLRFKFDHLATGYAPDAKRLLQIVKEEKEQHTKQTTTARGKKKQRR